MTQLILEEIKIWKGKMLCARKQAGRWQSWHEKSGVVTLNPVSINLLTFYQSVVLVLT
jgi:hypothetical protein